MKAKIDLLAINDSEINEKAEDKQITVFNDNLIKPSFPNDEQNEEKFIELKFKQNFEVFPIGNIAELMEQMGQHQSKKHKLRYLVDKELNLWFALEGFPNEKIPAHYQMVSLDKENAGCITAGNVKIKAGSLCMINHKSGFFRPSFDSMKWVLAILLYHKAELPPNFLSKDILIERLNSRGGLINTCNLTIEELKIVTDTFIVAELDSIANQPTVKKQVQNDFISILSPAVSPVKRPIYKPSDFSFDWLHNMFSPLNSPVKISSLKNSPIKNTSIISSPVQILQKLSSPTGSPIKISVLSPLQNNSPQRKKVSKRIFNDNSDFCLSQKENLSSKKHKGQDSKETIQSIVSLECKNYFGK